LPYSIDPKTSGDGIHRFLIGTAVLEAIEDRHDEVRFATSVETAVSVASDLINQYQEWWNKAMADVLLTDEGRSIYDEKGNVLLRGAEISKAGRQRQLGTLMLLTRKGGVFSRKRTGFDKKALEFFQSQHTEEEEEEEEDEGTVG
jgi:hypothetical protein